jgi:hypothetical protein
MVIIAHRRNTIEELLQTPETYGVEIDLRTFNNKLILQHDPFKSGELLEAWLPHYKHQLLILNVKEEGLEDVLISLMDKYGIRNYFFLDQSFPFLVKYSRAGYSVCSVRVSEFENVSTALSLKGSVDWVWVDYFTKFPLSKHEAEALLIGGFKLCLVSPELQGFNPESEIPKLIGTLESLSIRIDAVCTKRPDLWSN